MHKQRPRDRVAKIQKFRKNRNLFIVRIYFRTMELYIIFTRLNIFFMYRRPILCTKYFIRRCWFLKCSEEIHYVPIGDGDMWYYVGVDDGWEEVLGRNVYITSQYFFKFEYNVYAWDWTRAPPDKMWMLYHWPWKIYSTVLTNLTMLVTSGYVSVPLLLFSAVKWIGACSEDAV